MKKNILVGRLNNMKDVVKSIPNNPLSKLENIGQRFADATKAPMSKAPIPQTKMPQMTIDPRKTQPAQLQLPPMSSLQSTPAHQGSRFIGFQANGNIFDQLKIPLQTPPISLQPKPAKPAFPLQSYEERNQANREVIKDNGINLLKQYKAVGDLVADTYKNGRMEDEEIARLYPEFKEKIGSARAVMTEVYDAIAEGGTPDFMGMKKRYPELFQGKKKEIPYANLKSQEHYRQQDEKSKNIWEKMKNLNPDLLSDNGKRFHALIGMMNDIPQQIRQQYQVPADISDTEITSYVVQNTPELKSAFDELTKIKLTKMDEAMLGIQKEGKGRVEKTANTILKARAGAIQGINRANEWFQEKVTQEVHQGSQLLEKDSNGWGKVMTVPAKGIVNTVQQGLNALDTNAQAQARLDYKDYSSAGEIVSDGIKAIGSQGELAMMGMFPGATLAFNTAGETDTGAGIIHNTIGLIPEGINNILQSTPGVEQWYNSLDEQGKSYVSNGLTMALLHKANSATKNTQFNAKMALGVVKDAVNNAVKRGRDATKFQAWVEKGLKNSETGQYQKGAIGRTVREGMKEFKGAMKENFGKFDEVLQSRRQSVTSLTDQRGMGTKIKNDVIKPQVEQVKAGAEQVIGGIKSAGKQIKTAGNQLKQGVIEGAEKFKTGTKNIIGGIKGNLTSKSDLDGLTPKSEKGMLGKAVDMTAGILDHPADYIAEKITSTSSGQDKLFKAQNPSLNRLGRKDKSYEQKREKADRANELIIERGFMPKNAQERMEAHKATMDAIWNEQIEKRIKEKAKVEIEVKEIVDEMKGKIAQYKGGTLLSVHKNDYKRVLKDIADLEKKQTISIAEAENLKQQANMAIDWNNGPGVGELYQKSLRAMTKKIGEIEDRILSAMPGEFDKFKKDWGALRDGYEDVVKAYLKEAKRNGEGIMETYGKFEGIGEVLTAFTSGNPRNIISGLGKITLGKAYGRAKNVDFLIENGFKQLAKELEAKKGKIGKETEPQTPLAPKKTKNILGDTIAKNAKQAIQKRSGGNVSNSTPNEEIISKKNKIARAPILGLKKTGKTGNGGESEYTMGGKKETAQPAVSFSSENEPALGVSFFAKQKTSLLGKKYLKTQWQIERNGEQIVSKVRKNDQFSNTLDLGIEEGEREYVENVKKVIAGEKSAIVGSINIGETENPIRLTEKTFLHIFRKHGAFNPNNLVATINRPDYKIADVINQKTKLELQSKGENKINLFKQLDENHFLVVGVNMGEGDYIATHFEVIDAKGQKLVNYLRKGSPLDQKTQDFILKQGAFQLLEEGSLISPNKPQIKDTKKLQARLDSVVLKEQQPTTETGRMLNDNLLSEKSKGKGKKLLGLPDKSQTTKKSDFKALSNFSIENKKNLTEKYSKARENIDAKYEGLYESKRKTLMEEFRQLQNKAVKTPQDLKTIEKLANEINGLKNKYEALADKEFAIDHKELIKAYRAFGDKLMEKTREEIDRQLLEVNKQTKKSILGDTRIMKQAEKADTALSEEAIREKYRQKAIKELELSKGTTEINLGELKADKKKWKIYNDLMEEMQKELGYLSEDGYRTKKWYDDYEARKEKVYGKQKSTFAEEEKVLGDARIHKKAEKSDFEVLPSDVDVLEEAKKLGPKRIAPDRKAHQQLDPQVAMEKLAESEKKLRENKIKNLEQDLEKYRSIMEKYDGKLPARTEKNRIKYPDLIREYGEIQHLKKQYSLAGEITKSQNIEQTIEGMIEFNKKRIEGITPESMKGKYIELVQQDISKGYKYPEAVLDFVPEAKKILNGRERYEKGLHTSFSAKDERINYEHQEELGSGMKRQDGKQLTQEQKEDIVEGVKDFGNILGIDMKKLGEEKKWVYVHLNGKNVFLKNGVSGLYREKGENISISIGGIETVRQTLGGEVSSVKVHTVMSHELGHALDAIQNWKLFPSGKLFDLKIRMNKAPTSNARYWKSDAEITARAIEQYIAIKKGHTDYYEKPAYWKKEIYEHIIEPMVKEGIEAKFGGYMKGKIQPGKPLPKSSQDRESAMIWFSEKTSKKITDLTKQYPAEGKNELEKIGKLNSGIPKSSGKRSEKDKAIYRIKDDILLDDIIEKGLTIKDEGEQTTYTLEQDGVYVTWHLGDRVRRILKQKGLLK